MSVINCAFGEESFRKSESAATVPTERIRRIPRHVEESTSGSDPTRENKATVAICAAFASVTCSSCIASDVRRMMIGADVGAPMIEFADDRRDCLAEVDNSFGGTNSFSNELHKVCRTISQGQMVNNFRNDDTM